MTRWIGKWGFLEMRMIDKKWPPILLSRTFWTQYPFICAFFRGVTMNKSLVFEKQLSGLWQGFNELLIVSIWWNQLDLWVKESHVDKFKYWAILYKLIFWLCTLGTTTTCTWPHKPSGRNIFICNIK